MSATAVAKMTSADADARLAGFAGRRGWQIGGLGAALTLGVCVIWIGAAWVEMAQTGQSAIAVDFRVGWAAARLALEGAPLDAFDPARLNAVHGVAMDEWMPWVYPPGYLAALMPLGLLPFGWAWALFTALSVAAILAAVRPFAAGLLPVQLGFALAPTTLSALLLGQTSLLWSAGLLAALAALRAERAALAGVFIGLLTLKPQLGLLIPAALLAAGAWRTILAAAVTALLLAAGPTLLFGPGYWPQLLGTMDSVFAELRGAVPDVPLMISPYSALAGLGLPEAAALTLQWGLTAIAAGAVAFAWRSPGAGFDLRAAVLLAAIPLSSPYLWHYESALLAPAALFIIRAGVVPTRGAGLLLPAALWLGLGPSILLQLFAEGAQMPFRLVFAPLALLSFGTCVAALWSRHRAPGGPDASSAADPTHLK
ncbi:MAG: glycosyltransferase family 87 protein [Paracoccaceae bacterium]